MLFEKRLWSGIADGTVTCAVRRWKRPTVRAGGNLRSAAGYLEIDAVTPITDSDLTAELATAAGYGTLEELRASLRAPSPDRALYRIDFHVAGADPRETLRNDTDISADDLEGVAAKLDAMDRRSETPWTLDTLAAIEADPGVVSTDLAASLDRVRHEFKRDVTKLKRLGLTISLQRGYRLSPRGEIVLEHLRRSRT